MKRIFSDKIYWLSVMAAIFLLLCSVVYTEVGKEYTFLSLFYDEVTQEALEMGRISVASILMGYDTGYLWMFCPIIVGIPCVLTKKTERLVLFRTSKNKYLLMKYVSNLFASGAIILLAYLTYMILTMFLIQENIWDVLLVKKLLSVFCWGIMSAIPSLILAEYVHNKYLILCIPFVLNYFMVMFLPNILPYEIKQYIDPSTYQILFLQDTQLLCGCVVIILVTILACGVLKKATMERRCDCGQ